MIMLIWGGREREKEREREREREGGGERGWKRECVLSTTSHYVYN